MTQIDIHSKKTEQAWNTLYARLEKDGLLIDEKKKQKAASFRLHTLRWAAAVVVLCLSATSVYYLAVSGHTNKSLLALQNTEASTTLVASLEDGSMVYLDNNARLEYPEHFAPERREVSLQGNALFEVSGNPEHPFLIEAGKAQIEVIGTAFRVQNTRGVPFALSVQHGKVKVTLKENGQVKYVTAGQTIQLANSGLEVFPTRESEQFFRYLNRVQFKDVALAEILRVVNQKHPGTRLATTPELADRKLTVSFEDDSPEQITELICAAFSLRFTKEGNTLLIAAP